MRQAATIAPSLPTLKMRGGNFSELLGLPSPIVLQNPFTNSPYPGNIIPPDMLNQGLYGIRIVFCRNRTSVHRIFSFRISGRTIRRHTGRITALRESITTSAPTIACTAA